MKLLILTAVFSAYTVFGLVVLLTDGDIFWRLLALFIFPILLYGLLVYPRLKQLRESLLKQKETHPTNIESNMSLDMAYRLLDLPKNAPLDQVNHHYKRFIHIVHPDAGGATHLAKLLNEAKNIIIGHASDSK